MPTCGSFFNLINGISDLLGSADRICKCQNKPLSGEITPGIMGGVLLQAINPKAYVVNTSLITGFGYMPDNLTLIILKILITNAIWIPLHLGWLYAGTLLYELNLSQRTQRTINILMALSMLMVVLAAAFTRARGVKGHQRPFFHFVLNIDAIHRTNHPNVGT